MARARQFTGRKIDFKQWDTAPGLIAEVSTSGNSLSGSLAFTVPATILRWRGYVSAMFDETQQVGDQMIITAGALIAPTDTFAAGGGSFPDPATEPEYSWVWWKEFRLDAFVAAGHSGGWGPNAQRYELDSKAMRKIKPGESLGIVLERSNLTGAPNTLLDIGFLRVLIGT